MKNRGDLKTEQQNPNSKNIGTMEIKEILATIVMASFYTLRK